jgi:Fusaric acid resistance protein family
VLHSFQYCFGETVGIGGDQWNWALAKAAEAVPSLLFGLRLWAAVCIALFVAFWLELDNPFWAGTSTDISRRRTLLLSGWEIRFKSS